MAQWAMTLVDKPDPEFDPQVPRGGWRELAPACCPLTFTSMT